MDWTSLILLSFALCFDSVAASAVVGMCAGKANISCGWRLARFCMILALMQGLMPLVGWGLASNFREMIEKWDHWIAFTLLFIIGFKMMSDISSDNDDEKNCPMLLEYTKLSRSLLMGLATSIDALIVGVTMALLNLAFIQASQLSNMLLGALVIASVTFVCSEAGTIIGKIGGKGIGRYSNIVGGLILIGIGARILIEHLDYI